MGLLACIGQSTIQNCAHFLFRNSAGQTFTIHEQGGGGIHANFIGLSHGGPDSALVRFLNASLQFLRIEMMFVPLLDREFIEIEEGLCAVMSRYRLLVAMNIIRKVPVSIVVLFTQAICIYGCVHCPRMDVHKREIFIDDPYLVAVLLQQPWKKRGMHAGTERTL